MLQEVLPEGASFGIVHRWLSVHGLVLDCGQFDGAGEVRHPCKADGRSRDCRHTISHAPMTISEYVEFCFAPARDVDKGVRMFFLDGQTASPRLLRYCTGLIQPSGF